METGSKVSIAIVVALVTGIFSLYQVIGPIFEEVKVNSSKLAIHHEAIVATKNTEKTAQEFRINMVDRVGYIEGSIAPCTKP